MSLIKTAHINILESATVSLSAGAEDADYPLYRLYDRNIGRMFKPQAVATLEIGIDQGSGASPTAADTLLIPSGHNLAGMTLDIKHSDDDVIYTEAVAQWTGAAGVIHKSWSPLTKRYWKFIVTSPAMVPEIPELFLTSAYEWPRNPARPSGPLDAQFNVQNDTTASGADRFLTLGAAKRKRSYAMPRCTEAHKTAVLALNDAWAGALPFWLCDHAGAWIFGRLTSELDLKESAYQSYGFTFDFMEVLP